jgi:ribosomal protein S12 methylthiotransferase
VVVNTCGFIDAAVEESLDAIGEALAENGKCHRHRLPRRQEGRGGESNAASAHPKVLAVTGPHATEEVMDAVHRTCRSARSLHRPGAAAGHPPHARHYAYLKISEGCNHRCTFCIIPSMRGDLVSRPIGDVMREAETLAAAGVQGTAGDFAGHQRLRRRRQVPHRLLTGGR